MFNVINEENLMEHQNRIELRGRIGTIRTNEVNGSKVANFSVVTEYLYKSREGNAVDETTWFNVTAWHTREMPDFELLTKGRPVYVAGRMRTARYTTSEGTEKQFYEILANRVRLISDIESD